jgi:hypothetical protein
MKIVFDHKFGAQEHVQLEYYNSTLVDVGDDEFDTALARGWLTNLNSKGDYYWYQCRSTRCNLSKFNKGAPYPDVAGRQYTTDHEVFFAVDPNTDQIEQIYKDYCIHKKFNSLFHSEVNNWLECDTKVVYYDATDPIAWSKLRLYTENALETVLFAWNYKNPKLRVGINSMIHELNWAKEHSFKYVYLGPGYEVGSIYKANIDGFEWWTGSEWSTNTVEYIRLCERDSKLTTIKQISEL